MSKLLKKYDKMTTEELIDSEMEFYRDLEKEESETELLSAKEITPGPETKNGIIVNHLNVRLRKEPSLESSVVGILSLGDRVTILNKVCDFYKVITNKNVTAYVFSDCIKEE